MAWVSMLTDECSIVLAPVKDWNVLYLHIHLPMRQVDVFTNLPLVSN
jgi:hypothetical protein